MYYFGYYVTIFNMDRAHKCSRFCTASGLGFAGTLVSAIAMVSVLFGWEGGGLGEIRLLIGKYGDLVKGPIIANKLLSMKIRSTK